MSDEPEIPKFTVVSFGQSDGKSMGYDIAFPYGPVITLLPEQAKRLHELLGIALEGDDPSP